MIQNFCKNSECFSLRKSKIARQESFVFCRLQRLYLPKAVDSCACWAPILFIFYESMVLRLGALRMGRWRRSGHCFLPQYCYWGRKQWPGPRHLPILNLKSWKKLTFSNVSVHAQSSDYSIIDFDNSRVIEKSNSRVRKFKNHYTLPTLTKQIYNT